MYKMSLEFIVLPEIKSFPKSLNAGMWWQNILVEASERALNDQSLNYFSKIIINTIGL